MSVDFQQLQEDVVSIKSMLTLLTNHQSQPVGAVPAEEILTIQQTADFLNLTTQTVYGLVSARKIPFSKPTGSKLYFFRLELIEWLKANRTSTIQEQTQQYDKGRSIRQPRRGGRKVS